MRRAPIMALVLLPITLSCSAPQNRSSQWKLSESARTLVAEDDAERMFRALDAARTSGTDPAISGYQVRAATVVVKDGQEHVIVGGNSEYLVPEAIHAETSLLNHVANVLGAPATRTVKFMAFYTERQCGTGLSCGDCRDYQIATTDFENLLVVCGQASDHTVHVRRFAEAVVSEDDFPLVTPDEIPLNSQELTRLVEAARKARRQGVSLFTSSEHHAGAAGLSSMGNVYSAAGVDDAAFHYRYPIGGLLQQAATEGDYFIKAIVVAGEAGKWPRVSYRERQYGHESSSFNKRRNMEPISLILTNGQGLFRLTTFEKALPHAFSADAFMPEAVDEFLESKAAPASR